MQILSIFLATTATYFTVTQAATTGMLIADAAADCGPKGCHDCDPGCKTPPFKCPPGEQVRRYPPLSMFIGLFSKLSGPNLDLKAGIRWETPSVLGRHHAAGQYPIRGSE
ncbi:hypothetical protein BDDG_01775 [Blastomyces dermatitidis ATCC 18188]|uniref:Uncharacterized protein n=1 Tax=Ajellomyces dermatitidis (strain ATCC 18188 / CBS 674.68) TaxID=653446 RepID=F2T6M4_AJEDA|nr:hypothetical protein BDDG_01775 [Blastomyces dermatitidis ATCC 18188]EQL36553.1 hypothetical protein BDFG_01934 [Blastomyces dermatitidis ATCC 26199]